MSKATITFTSDMGSDEVRIKLDFDGGSDDKSAAHYMAAKALAALAERMSDDEDDED